ncbi:MAG: hypothetical protein LC777_10595 [Actinobacteria bacterium]|nr:hypothetical protein [Actinomycetota bacterium]
MGGSGRINPQSGCCLERDLRSNLLAGDPQIDVSLDDLDDGRARRADRVACGAIQDAVGLDRVVEVDPVDVAATAERRSGVQSD